MLIGETSLRWKECRNNSQEYYQDSMAWTIGRRWVRIESLKHWNLQGDFIKSYKITRGTDKVNVQSFPGKGKQKLGLGWEGIVLKGIWWVTSHRVVCFWNKFPEKVVESGKITPFKRYLARYLGRKAEREMRQVGKWACLDGASWSPWLSWAEGQVSMLYYSIALCVSMSLLSGGNIQPRSHLP